MNYLLSLHEIMFYFIFVHNYIWILDKAFNIDFCLFNFIHVLLFTISYLVHSLNSGGVRVKHVLIGTFVTFITLENKVTIRQNSVWTMHGRVNRPAHT
jgi:hypothetical protein